jgi:UDP-N-acetylmuramate dehydrogenase
MKIGKNISLKPFNTFGLDYQAKCYIRADSESEAKAFFKKEIPWEMPLLILGGGSNVLFTGDFRGTIIHPQIQGIRVDEHKGDNVIISAGAGVNWDVLVDWAVNEGFWGLENLSLIPGSAGASAVQNIGAYGAEVKDMITKVETISVRDGSRQIFSNNECEFSYRNSIFKSREKGRYLVTRVYFKLNTKSGGNLNYGSLKEETMKLGDESLINIRQAVINIRQSKLPDPAVIGNAGSFFKNPVTSMSLAEDLRKKYPGIPFYPDGEGSAKLAAAWLIEQCGWKGKRKGDAGIHDKQALVIVNHGNAKGEDIFKLSEEVRLSVSEKFGIHLDREVEVIGII